MLRTLSVATLAALVLVPLGAAEASAAPVLRPATVSAAALTTTATTSTVAPVASARANLWRKAVDRRRSRLARLAAPVVSPAQAYQDRVLVLTNAERAARGLAPLLLSTCADGYADRWAASLLAAGVLSHQPLTPILTACSARSVGENVAYGNVTPEELVAMWMASTGHRANILNATFNRLGVGAVSSSTGRWYGVQVFLRV